MQLIYLDESECQQYNTYFVGAIVASPKVTHELIGSMDKLGLDLADRFGVPERAEFHGHAILDGSEDWSKMAGMKSACIDVFERAIDIITSFDLQVCIRGLDVKAQKARYTKIYPPHQVCLEQVIQRLHSPLYRESDYAILFADEHHLDRRLRGQLRRWQEFGTESPYMRTRPTNFLDTIHFTPSSESRMIQAIDLVLYYFQRKYFVEKRAAEGKAMHPKEAALMGRLEALVTPILHPDCDVWVP